MIPYNNPIEKCIELLQQQQRFSTNLRVRELKRLVFDFNMSLFPNDKIKAMQHILYGFDIIDNMLTQGRCSGKTSLWIWQKERKMHLMNLIHLLYKGEKITWI